MIRAQIVGVEGEYADYKNTTTSYPYFSEILAEEEPSDPPEADPRNRGLRDQVQVLQVPQDLLLRL